MEQRRVTQEFSILDAFGPSVALGAVESGRGGPVGPQARGRTRESLACTEGNWLGEEVRPTRRERIRQDREARRVEFGADDPGPSWAAACHLWDQIKADIRDMPAEHEAEGWDLVTETLIAFRLTLSKRFDLGLDVDLRSGR